MAYTVNSASTGSYPQTQQPPTTTHKLKPNSPPSRSLTTPPTPTPTPTPSPRDAYRQAHQRGRGTINRRRLCVS